MNVTDLVGACSTKSQAEVSKDFVKAASYILSAAVGGKDGVAGAKKVAKKGKPLWDTA